MVNLERKRKRRSLAFCSLCRYPPAVAANYPLNGRQPDPGTGEIGRCMKALERAE
jgi:hypothetical protein